MRTVWLASLLLAVPVVAQTPSARSYPEGEKLIMNYFKEQVKQISDACLKDVGTRESWEANRPEMRRQFLDMMGLWPLPEKTPLKATITGTVEGDGFIVEKLHFQSRPGLYVTANVYRPKNPPTKKLPAILYVCGHGNVVENGISFGSKVYYQYHPAWFAKNGYVCMILDTLQLGEIQGLHHGTYRLNMWWWQSRGYTPGGVELWNGIRALDYLETRDNVDSSKIGLTGRSGGGASSWWIAAADDRIKAVAPVAGIADLQAQLVEGEAERLKSGVIAGHCDCMFMVNRYRWDFAQVAALVAPRPLLLGNSDADEIFPVGGYRRIATKVNKVYALYGAEEKFQLLETKGAHVDTPELRRGINRWMNRWLKGNPDLKIDDELPPKLKPEQLRVFQEIPLDSVNENVHEVFTQEFELELPKTDKEIRYWWAVKQSELMKRLEREVFAGWPKNPPALAPKMIENLCANQMRLQVVEFQSEVGMPLRLFIIQPDDLVTPSSIRFNILDEDQFSRSSQALPASFAKVMGLPPSPEPERPRGVPEGFAPPNRTATLSRVTEGHIIVNIIPRGIGPTQWADEGTSFDNQVKRRFALIGQTLDGQRVWDIRRAIQASYQFLKVKPDAKIEKQLNASSSTSAGLAVYAGLFEPSLTEVGLSYPPYSLREGPTLLMAQRYLDNQLALALLATKTTVSVFSSTRLTESNAWAIAKSIAEATQNRNLKLQAVPSAIGSMTTPLDRPGSRANPFQKK